MLVGVLVAVSGGIGFVGLIMPHLARILVGARHRVVLPVAALGGALFLLWIDVAARVLLSPEELPLGVMTGLVGARCSCSCSGGVTTASRMVPDASSGA